MPVEDSLWQGRAYLANRGDLLVYVSQSWGVPVAVAELVQSGAKRKTVHLAPDKDNLSGVLGLSCGRFPACFRKLVREQGALLADGTLLGSARCSRNRTILFAPFRLPGNHLLFILCGCLPRDFEIPEQPTTVPRSQRYRSLKLPVSLCRSARHRQALVSSILQLRLEVTSLIEMFREREWFRRSALEYGEDISAVVRSSNHLLDAPDSNLAFLKALGVLGRVRAVGHLETDCDHRGGGTLRHRWFAINEGESPRFLGSQEYKRVAPLKVEGRLCDGWDLAEKGYACDSDNIRFLKESRDPLRRYLAAFEAYLKNCTYIIIGRVGRNVARGSCDIDPYCEHKEQCRLFARDEGVPEAERSAWRKRMVAVDLLFFESPGPDAKARMVLVQMASQFRSLHAEREMLEKALLEGLPHLREKEQRYFLRYLFEHCRAIAGSQEKGLAFERLAHGILGLVPGWIPGERSKRTPENELDLAVLVEPSVSAARYWWESFGPKILVECKNYPSGLSARIKGRSPVLKLQGIMKRAKVKLGLLLNTGTISDQLWIEAQRSSRPGNLVVLLDGTDLRTIIENPRDTEHLMKQKVSDAAIRVKPSRG